MSMIQTIGTLIAEQEAAENNQELNTLKRYYKPKEYERSLIEHDPFYVEKSFVPDRMQQKRMSRMINPSNLGPQLKSVPQELMALFRNLDITRITNRLIVCGTPIVGRTNQAMHLNNANDLALFLNTRYGKKYLIWNLSADSNRGTYDSSIFCHQVVAFPFSKAYNSSLKTLIDICKSLSGWLALDVENVAVIHSSNGISKVATAVCSYLFFAQTIQSTNDAFEYFKYRLGADFSISPSQMRYLEYFENLVIEAGVLSNPYPLCISKLTLNGIPKFETSTEWTPGLEIYENGKLLLTTLSRRRAANSKGSVLVEAEKDRVHFKFPKVSSIRLERDVQIRIFRHIKTEKVNQILTIASFSFHTGFMLTQGVVRVAQGDLEVSQSDSEDCKYPDNFSLDILLAGIFIGEDHFQISYAKLLDISLAKCLTRLACYHSVKANEEYVNALEGLGYPRYFAFLSLSMNNNNFDSALRMMDTTLAQHPALTTGSSPASVGTLPDKMSRFDMRSNLSSTSLSSSASHRSERENVPKSGRSNGSKGYDYSLDRVTATANRLAALLNQPAKNRRSIKSNRSSEEYVMRAKTVPAQITENETVQTQEQPRINLQHEAIYNSQTDLRFKIESIEALAPSPSRSQNSSMDEMESLLNDIKQSKTRGIPRSFSESSIPSPLSNYPISNQYAISDTISPGDVNRNLSSIPNAIISGGISPKGIFKLKRVNYTQNSPKEMPNSSVPYGEQGRAHVQTSKTKSSMISNASSTASRKTNNTLPSVTVPNLPPPPPPPNAPLPPPPPMPGNNPEPPNGEPYEPKIRARAKLHWNEIRNVKGSVWNELSGQNAKSSIKLDIMKFEELFCVVPGEERKKIKKAVVIPKTKFTTFFDIRRSNNIAIGLAKFQRRGMAIEEIFDAINEMDQQVLSSDDLLNFSALLPTNDELYLVRKHSKITPEYPYAPAESFAIKSLEYSDISKKILAFLFALQYEIELEEATLQIEKLMEVTNLLKNSEKFKKLLKVVLELGNMTNYEYSSHSSSYRPWMGKQAKALGFKIDGLARLADVKSADGKWNLMMFLVDMIERQDSTLLDIADEFQELSTVRLYDIQAITNQIKNLMTTQEGISRQKFDSDFCSRIIPILEDSREKIEEIKKKLMEFINLWTETMRYLGEDLDEYIVPTLGVKPAGQSTRKSPSHLYLALDMFLKAYKSAVTENRIRNEEAAQRLERRLRAEKDQELKAIREMRQRQRLEAEETVTEQHNETKDYTNAEVDLDSEQDENNALVQTIIVEPTKDDAQSEEEEEEEEEMVDIPESLLPDNLVIEPEYKRLSANPLMIQEAGEMLARLSMLPSPTSLALESNAPRDYETEPIDYE